MYSQNKEHFEKEYGKQFPVFLVAGMMSEEESDVDMEGQQVLIRKRPQYRSAKVSICVLFLIFIDSLVTGDTSFSIAFIS
jgi:hypothetical protein